MQAVSFIITLIILSISAKTDYTSYKVYNIITFPSMLAGLILCRFPFSANSFIRLAWMVIFFLIGQLHLMGMGDLKLCMAVIALRGIEEAAWMLLSGAILLFVYCFITDRQNTVLMLKDTYNTLFYHTPVIKRTDKKYPFAVFLAIGYILIITIRWWVYA